MKRLLSATTKVFGSLFLYGGGTVSTGVLVGISTTHASGFALTMLSILLVFFGLAPASLGSWLLYTSAKVDRQVMRDRFFQLLQTRQGKISLVDFAAATQLDPIVARRYLDRWAKECLANFEVSEAGDIYYVFTNDPRCLKSKDLRLLKEFTQHQQILPGF
jgi:hypothetical protein